MKRFELDSRTWIDEQREQAFKKLEEIGYKPMSAHLTDGYNGMASISAWSDGGYLGYDFAGVNKDGQLLTFEQLIMLTKEDVKDEINIIQELDNLIKQIEHLKTKIQ